MRIVLILLLLNHACFLGFEQFIEGVMSEPKTAGQAPGYGIFYALLVFPLQLFAELLLAVALFYQAFIVKKWQASLFLWAGVVVTFFMIIPIGY